MTKIYQLMIGRNQINDLYYDRDDAEVEALLMCLSKEAIA